MTLLEALHTLGLRGQIDPSGRWVRLQGERCGVYVYEVAWDGGYYTWCEEPGERTVEFYRDATQAIQAGLRRADARTTVEGVNAATMEGGGEQLETTG